MPRIRVEWLVGRTEAQRQELATRLTNAMCEVAQLEPDQVTVVFEEVDRDRMYKGAVPWSKLGKQPLGG